MVGWLIQRRARDAAPLDADLVAVAPFDVPDGRLSLWREGLVDVLSRNLDGAGPVRSVPSTTVIRRWSGRADQPSAADLGRRTGARLVVFGSLIGAGPDSARLTATAFDVAENRPLADIELRDADDRMDRLADSLTVRLLRELGRTRRIGVFRATAMGSTSLPALKAFLRGEQWFRRASWDSAYAAYDEAIALDSTFALALWRSSKVLGWWRTADDSVSVTRAIRAGGLTRGLAPRDSLLVTTDSLLAEVDASCAPSPLAGPSAPARGRGGAHAPLPRRLRSLVRTRRGTVSLGHNGRTHAARGAPGLRARDSGRLVVRSSLHPCSVR